MTEGNQNETISLYYQDGGSDKVYHAQIEKAGDGYLVNFSFGRRGSTLQTGTKTSKPVPYESAKKIFNQLVNSKKAKGYAVGGSRTPYVQTNKEEKVSGVNCQLLNSIEENELAHYLENDRYGAQEKMDGNRLLIRKTGNEIEGINRKGLLIDISQIIQKAALDFDKNFVIDGEVLGDAFYAFDMLFEDEKDIREYPYKERYKALQKLLKGQTSCLHLLKLSLNTEQKKALHKTLLSSGKEGIVIKDLDAPYRAGRPVSGGSQIKFKFYDTATVKVESVNLKRSVSMCLLENTKWISVGNVTIPPNFEIPSTGDVVEVRYLYAYQGGSLYQPTYLGLRIDGDDDDCQLKQLKYKNNNV